MTPNTDKIRYTAQHPNGDGLDYVTSEDGRPIAYFLYARTPGTDEAMMRVGATATEDHAQATKEAIDLAPTAGAWLAVMAKPDGFAPIEITYGRDLSDSHEAVWLAVLEAAENADRELIVTLPNGQKVSARFDSGVRRG